MSALTSLLVRDDAVSVRQIEEALARQVVDGGELDTALLELSALPENKLIAYRAASERGQPATREQVMSASSATRALLPGDLAIALQVSPLSHDDSTLTVAAVRTLKPAEMAQLVERTGKQIHVRITSELRLLAALERFYGHALLPRHAVLLNRVDAQPPGELVFVEPMQAAVVRASMKTEQLPAFEEAEDFQAVLAAAFERASMSPHAGTPAVDPDETRPLSAKRAFETQRRRSRAPEETAKLGSGLIQARPSQSTVRASVPVSPEAEQDAQETRDLTQRGAPNASGDGSSASAARPGAYNLGLGERSSASAARPGAAQRGAASPGQVLPADVARRGATRDESSSADVAQRGAASMDHASSARVPRPGAYNIAERSSAGVAHRGAASMEQAPSASDARSGSESLDEASSEDVAQRGAASLEQAPSGEDARSGSASREDASSAGVGQRGAARMGQWSSASDARSGSASREDASSAGAGQRGAARMGQWSSASDARSGSASLDEASSADVARRGAASMEQASPGDDARSGSASADSTLSASAGRSGAASVGEASNVAQRGAASVGHGSSASAEGSGSASFDEASSSAVGQRGAARMDHGASASGARSDSASMEQRASAGVAQRGAASVDDGLSGSGARSDSASLDDGASADVGQRDVASVTAANDARSGSRSGAGRDLSLGDDSPADGSAVSMGRASSAGDARRGASNLGDGSSQRGAANMGGQASSAGDAWSAGMSGEASAASSARPAASRARVVQPTAAKLSMADTQGALSTVEDRDAVMDIYFRYARQLFDATALFTLKDGRAVGSQAHNIRGASDIRDVSLPVVRGSALEELTRTLVPRVIDLGRKDEDRALVSGIKRLDCQPAALMPICIKRRVVAVLYGDRGGAPLHLDELTDLLTLMPHVTTAFERIIRARKALGLTGTPSLIGELSHAPTQRSMPAAQGFSSEARTTELPEHAKQALEALKIPQALPKTRGFGLPDDDGDIYATARIPIQPLPLDQFDSPPRYLSKPPPGTGRYQSFAPKGTGAEEVLRSPSTPSEQREERTASSRRPPPRSDASPADGRRNSFVPAAPGRRPSNPPPGGRRNSAAPPAPNARRSVLPPPANAATTSASSHPSLAAPKPAPGSGVYHSQAGTTELINMPPGRKDDGAAPPSQELASAAQGYFTRSDSRAPVAANQNEEPRTRARVSSLPPKSAPEERPNPITQLIDALCRSEPNEDPPAIKALVALGEPALTALLARFPGPLWFDRRKPHARLPLGRDISPICRALDAFGDQATERLGPALGSNMTEVRYYATLFAGDRVRPSLLEPMLTRLFDDDPQIRLLVRDALPHYRKYKGFERVTERICDKARAESAPLYERLAAIDAICMLRDQSCVSTLIDLIGHRDKQICVPAHRALTLITCQDFGKSPRKWRSWLNANADRHRVEWLIEGLMHSEESMRATAGLELQKLTQVYYGYVAAASKREREAAQKRYAEWWRTEGRTRIAT